MANVTLKQLRAFVAVSRDLSLTKAATLLNVSQPALTMQLKQLELEIGTTLFDRTTRRLTITRAGEILLPIATKILNDIESGLEEVDLAIHGRAASVGIVAGGSIIDLAVAPAIARIAAMHPHISARVSESVGEEIFEQVASGVSDFGIANFPSATGLVETHFLLKDQIGILCSRQHVLAGRRHVYWRDILEYPFATSKGHGTAVRNLIQTDPLATHALPPPKYVTSNISLLFSLVEQSACIALLPRLATIRAVEMGMVFRPLVDFTNCRELYLVTPRHRKLRPTSRLVALAVVRKLQAIVDEPEIKTAIAAESLDDVKRLLQSHSGLSHSTKLSEPGPRTGAIRIP